VATISETPLARKIRALMAKANDPSVGEHEAAAFMAKVQELLVKNGLSMGDVKRDEETEVADVGKSNFGDEWKSPSRKNLLRAVCRYYMCEAIAPGRKGMGWTIVGRPHNVAVAVEMTEYLIKTTVRLSGKYGRENPGVNVIDFRKGCMARLAERLIEELMKVKMKTPEYRPDGNPGNLPALFVSERTLVKQFMEQKMDVKYKAARPIRAGLDAAAGRAAGNTISLHKQVGQQTGGGGRLQIGKR
jgi:hypothetical protein